ncbi:Methyltransferase domain protein [Cupriavidus necator]|uniref:Methyltransferase domain protein n=1 Tax=Cupriavidus necator TaxID=106590 RepID=A0A1K0JFD2_CUPNE|nr:Methyltransferase domain protein [Cupriavidus necator]
MDTPTDLVKSISIDNLANQRLCVVERVRASLDLLAEAERLARTAHLGFPRLVIDNSHARRGTPVVTGEYANRADAEHAILRTIDTQGWQYLLAESGLRTFMDARAREQWNRQIAEGDVPELTAANIEATFSQLYRARGEMFERGVIACFQRLSWDYKTNQPFRFGKRLIVTYLFSHGSPNHRITDELDDLLRVMRVLDGQPEADHRHGAYHLITEAWRARLTEAQNDYLHVRWFRNGNGHLTFKRLDLVDQMNQILARHYPNALASEAR